MLIIFKSENCSYLPYYGDKELPGIAASIPPPSCMIPGTVAIGPLILIHIWTGKLHGSVIRQRIACIAVVGPQQTQVVTFGLGADGEGAVVSRDVLHGEVGQLDHQLVDLGTTSTKR